MTDTELEKGRWCWADIYDLEGVDAHPENPNVNCFSIVWVPWNKYMDEED